MSGRTADDSAVAGEDERPLRARAVRQPPGQDLQHAVRRFGGAFDDAERDGAGAEDVRQEERQKRIDGLARRVGGEAHPPEEPDGTRKAE